MSKKIIYLFVAYLGLYLIGSAQMSYYLKLAKSNLSVYEDYDDFEEEENTKEESESKTEDFKEKTEERIGNGDGGIELVIYFEEIYKRFHNNEVKKVRSAQLEIVPPPPKF